MDTSRASSTRIWDGVIGSAIALLAGSAVLASLGLRSRTAGQERIAVPQRPMVRAERVEITAAFGEVVLAGEPAAHRKLAVLVTKADGSPLTGLKASNFHIVWAVGSGNAVGGGGYADFDWATTMRPALVNTAEPGVYGFDIGSGGSKPVYSGYKISVNWADREHSVHYQGATLFQMHVPNGD